ncbi:unnamed protein product [Acanthoscelides obtectus]|uniref:DUF4371 domain-containing protein n=1 Tax=Acanthoscelides obtectus TaxID=200917 RepID=A0A9P0K7I7_ACAOB|nr:unnamed protein product [Acanthoscelides obtectus]CAK1667424.1 hypothetical protein AOBTE_LOCUS25830 [Acanthoscelides obtectus]
MSDKPETGCSGEYLLARYHYSSIKMAPSWPLRAKPAMAGTSKEIQNDLLDCILEVCHEEIMKQINRASYLAIIADKTTDISGKNQLVPIFRYVFNSKPLEGLSAMEVKPALTLWMYGRVV